MTRLTEAGFYRMLAEVKISYDLSRRNTFEKEVDGLKVVMVVDLYDHNLVICDAFLPDGFEPPKGKTVEMIFSPSNQRIKSVHDGSKFRCPFRLSLERKGIIYLVVTDISESDDQSEHQEALSGGER